MTLSQINTFSSERIVGIIGRAEFESIFYTKEPRNCVLISVVDPDSLPHPKEILETFKDHLSVFFWDTTENEEGVDSIPKEEASKIRNFIQDHPNDAFLIHCSAGKSRSAAVAKAIECLLDFDGDLYSYRVAGSMIDRNPRYTPNDSVFKSIISN